MKKRTAHEILEKAAPSALYPLEVFEDIIWVPVSLEVYEKVKELLSVENNFVLGIKPTDGKRRERTLLSFN
jgi:hypothetical protein